MIFTIELTTDETKKAVETGAILSLISKVDGEPAPQPQAVASQPQAVAPQPQAVVSQPQAVASQPQAVASQPQAVPTVGATYDVNQLAVAAMQLKDQGRIAELQGLLTQFGVGSLVQLSSEQLPAFAQALQGLGVKL